MNNLTATMDESPPSTKPGLREFNPADKHIARRHIVIGYLITFVFLGSVFVWSALAPVSSAAIAPGVLGKEGYRKTVQHLEGGIIQQILVSDGQQVNEGDIIIELADLQSRSDVDLLLKQKYMAAAKEASLLAGQQNLEAVALPNWMQLETMDQSVRDAITGLIESTQQELRLHNEQLANIDRQIQQAKSKRWALQQERQALDKNIELVRAEVNEYLDLQEQGLVTRQTVFDLKRQLADKEADYSANRVDLQSTAQEVNALELQSSSLSSTRLKRIGEDLDSTRAELLQLDEKLSQTQDTLQRTVIRAPTSGTVINLQVTTVGGVIKAGQPLLDIVPDAGNLIIEARVNPMDRDTVAVGQDAEIRFSAFNRRVTEPVAGRVTLISADRLIDEITNEGYYQAKIELIEDPSTVLGGGQVYPGMLAEVFIITGSRTALSYVIDPVVKSFNRAFREE